jgi:two-component system copper resistance phosphate regulon response regulator CusR
VRVLIAEDDNALRDVLVRGLEEQGYVVDAVANGKTALSYLAVYEYEVVVLDWRMPVLSGYDALAAMRARRDATPVLMLTARDQPADRIAGLDRGADDYLVKPFDFGELLARLRALQRRRPNLQGPVLRCGGLEFDPVTHEGRSNGETLRATATELAILELLLRRSPGVVTRRQIALHVWPNDVDAIASNTIDVHVARLRAKTTNAGARIHTVRGVGYRLVAE